jgi:hypothetical protein
MITDIRNGEAQKEKTKDEEAKNEETKKEEDDNGGPAVVGIAALFVLIGVIATMIFLGSKAKQAPSAEAKPANQQSDYQLAVNQAVWPNPATVAHDLVQLKPADTLVAWTYSTAVSGLATKTTPTWVTVAPHLQDFCRDFVRDNGDDPDQLNLRLKQRLGLPPDAAYDTFVEFTVTSADFAKIFRPCGDWTTSTSTCAAVNGDDVWKSDPGIKPDALTFLVKNHYSRYATDHPYPWTALGYTFDWARKPDSSGDFIREGESEFVIPAGFQPQNPQSKSTADYCKP